jgi:hypothetical protein
MDGGDLLFGRQVWPAGSAVHRIQDALDVAQVINHGPQWTSLGGQAGATTQGHPNGSEWISSPSGRPFFPTLKHAPSAKADTAR